MSDVPEIPPLHINVNEVSQELKIRPEIYLKIVTSFSSTLDDKVGALRVAIATGDLETLRKVLHEIKGTSSNLRLANISRPESKMHDEVKGSANQDLLNQFLTELELEVQRLKEALERLKPPEAAA